MRAGIVAATYANMNRGKNSDPLHPNDFFPEFVSAKEKETKEQTLADAQMEHFLLNLPGVKKHGDHR